MSLTPEEIAEVRHALGQSNVPEDEIGQVLSLMGVVAENAEVPDEVANFYAAVGTAANALWQAKYAAVVRERDAAKDALESALMLKETAERDAALWRTKAHELSEKVQLARKALE